MFNLPDWTWEFHGHKCPFMPMGYMMGIFAMEKLGINRSKNHELHVLSEMGDAHPQGCLIDGIMSATGATFGKGTMNKLYYGKIAATFWHSGKGAVRISLKSDFADMLGAYKFFTLRKNGVLPSEVPQEVSQEVIDIVLNSNEEDLFKVEIKPDYDFYPVKSSFNKAKCEICGEYTFERYLRKKDGKNVCIPCSGY